MANRYYQPGEQRASRVQSLFNAIAPRYDLINDLQSLGLHRRWKRKLVRRAGIQRGEIALDVCCGTGDLAFSLSQAGARVVAVDFSAAMLAGAGRRASMREGTGEARVFVRGDALRLPVGDESVNVVTVGYGLRNLADLDQAVREFHRVTVRGGRLLILDFGKPSSSLWRAFYFAYLRLVVPVFGRVFCGDSDSYRYILESLREYPAQAGIAELLCGGRWESPETVDILGGTMSLTMARKP